MPPHPVPALLATLAAFSCLLGTTAATAHPGGWGRPMGGGMLDGPSDRSIRNTRDRSREGRIQVSRFVADGKADALGHGSISVTSSSAGDEFSGERERAPFEAAVIDQLVHAGYDTTRSDPNGGQVAELRITRTQIESAEARRKPVSGEAAVEVSNRGTAYGMALNVDLTKPLPPLVSTRLEARILDRATSKVLWEGRADVATRDGDELWTQQEIANRLAEALFDHFPRAS